ncbi:Uncharacterised protein [Klebsiella oxytoca]|nr:Uncharacterised protein [Klebsiella oxytoca]
MAGFSLSGVRTLHRTTFDYSAKGLTLRASAKALFNAAQAPVVRVRAPYSEEPAYGWVFAFQEQDFPSNCVRLFGPKALPCGPALKRCSTRRRRRLSESGRPIQKNPPMAGFSPSGYELSIELRSMIRPKGLPLGPALKRCSTRRLETNRMPYIKQSSLYIEKVARVEQQAQISASVISTSMRSPPFRYSTLVQLPLRRGGSCTKINFL